MVCMAPSGWVNPLMESPAFDSIFVVSRCQPGGEPTRKKRKSCLCQTQVGKWQAPLSDECARIRKALQADEHTRLPYGLEQRNA